MSNNSTFINKDGKKIKRQECQIYTRVMGYLRPVNHYNIGKKTEFYSRKYFLDTSTTNEELIKRENAKFIEQFTSIK